MLYLYGGLKEIDIVAQYISHTYNYVIQKWVFYSQIHEKKFTQIFIFHFATQIKETFFSWYY